jgi:DNA-binding response OmpR family regulator
MRALIIENTPFIRDSLRKGLLSLCPDAAVSESGSGKRAVEILKAETFDLVLCSWDLPDIKGQDILGYIKRDSRVQKTYFIMVTSEINKNLILEALHLGANDCIMKPFDAEVLEKKIRKAAGKIP